MKRIYVCSNFRATPRYSVRDNIKYACLCCRFVLKNGHAPFAPHLMCPWFLEDGDPSHRMTGIQIGDSYLEKCDEIWCFLRTMMDIKSEGMKHEISIAANLGIPIRDVYLPDDISVGTPIEVMLISDGRSSKLPFVIPDIPMFKEVK